MSFMSDLVMLNETQVLAIRNLDKDGYSARQIAVYLGIDLFEVYKVVDEL